MRREGGKMEIQTDKERKRREKDYQNYFTDVYNINIRKIYTV